MREFTDGVWWWWAPGQFDCYWLSYFDALRSYCSFSQLSGLIAVAENSAFALPFPDLVVFSAPPTRLARDARGRLHCEDGPAIAFADGWAVYAWHGVRVAPWVIEHPEQITADGITTEPNAELRRILLERFGTERYIRAIQAKVLDASDFGTLYRAEFDDDEPLVMVRVINSTAEPDGSFKEYWLRVPPHMERARDAVAWTFGVERGDAYGPVHQT